MRNHMINLSLTCIFLVAFAMASGALVWVAWNGAARMVVDVAYLDYTKCIAIALVGDMVLGLLALGTD